MNRKRQLSPTEENVDREFREGKRKFVTAGISKRIKDDRMPVPNIMIWPKEERLRYIYGTSNPFGYPAEYYDIYTRERQIRQPQGFDYLLNIDNIKLNPGKRIEQLTNVNCIKSRHDDEFNLDRIIFGENINSTLVNAGYQAYYTFDQFVENQMATNINFMERESELIRKYGIHYKWHGEYQDLIYEFKKDIRSMYDEIWAKNPNKYRIIIEWIKHCLGDYSQYVCIAGGFVLSMYIYEKYGIAVNFSDIDLFIHSCDEQTANKIVSHLGKITENFVYVQDNVVISYFNSAINKAEVDGISISESKISVQIIRRLYTSPAQIVLGFDVDCCCILSTLNGNVFISERGAYSLRHGYNLVNFERMSPSYEYRIMKYNRRGFGVWIPFVEHFKENSIFDANRLDKSKQSTIILLNLLKKTTLKMNYKTEKNLMNDKSDYYDTYAGGRSYKDFHKYEGEFVQFKTLNPDEQIINTFHRIVLEDPYEWYPKLPNNVWDKITVNQNDAVTNIFLDDQFVPETTAARNIMRRYKKKKPSPRMMQTCREWIAYLDRICPGTTITGDVVRRAYSGTSNNYGSGQVYKINNPGLRSQEEVDRLAFEMTKYRYLLTIRNCLVGDPDYDDGTIPVGTDPNSVGRIIFTTRSDFHNVSEEESFHNFMKMRHILSVHQNYDLGQYIRLSYNGLSHDFDVVYIPADEIDARIHHEYSRYARKSPFNNQRNPDAILKSFKNNFHHAFKHGYLTGERIRGMTNEELQNLFFMADLNQRNLLLRSGSYVFFQHSPIDSEFMDEVVYSNGQYVSTEYDKWLIMLNMSHDEISSGRVVVYDSPVYEQFFV